MDATTGLRPVLPLVLSGLLALPPAVEAVAFQYQLTFQSNDQSIWDTGAATTLDQTTFLGAQWDDKETRSGLIVGSTTTPNPLRATYDLAFDACRALGFSSSVCINGQAARVPVPALGSRPRVRSCGTFQFSCQAKRAGDIAKRAAYDVAFGACRAAGFSSTVCRNGQTGQIFVPALGTAPAEFLDTRTGVEVGGVTDGRVGLELGVKIDSGSVDSTVSYNATLDIPDTTTLVLGDPVNFNPDSQLAGVNTLDTNFSTVELSVDAIMQLSGSVFGEACAVLAGCAVGSSPFNIDERAPIFSFNQDGQGGVLFLGHQPSDFGFPDQANGFPFAVDVAGLAEVTLHFPQPDATGGPNALDALTQTLKAAGQDDLIDLLVDLDNVVATAAGVPGLFGSSFDIGGLGTIGYDIINVEMGPTIDLRQEFELTPTLFVNLDFDHPVFIGGSLFTSFSSPWDMLPDIVFTNPVTTVTPTFFVEADLENSTLLDFNLDFIIDLLQIFYDFGLLGDDTFGIGNVLNQSIDLFRSPDLYNNMFALQGWDLQIGQSFVMDYISGSRLPSSSLALSAFNNIMTPSVPEPGTLLLLGAGLWGLLILRRRSRVA